MKDILAAQVRDIRESGKTIGFVPTMGALHNGHISLVQRSKKENDITIASIFVNPTQFNDKDDLKRYPRMPEKDSAMLEAAGCDIVFIPDEKQVYPEPDTRIFDFGGLEKVMEGKHRPGHFNGVAQVVTRLFDMVKPHRAYFGIKDFQQLVIIRYVVKTLHYPVEIVACPIIREPDGLAMSSRNMLLSADERKTALILSKSLFEARELKSNHDPVEIVSHVTDKINATPGIDLEYFEIVNGSTLLPVSAWEGEDNITGCIAARVGKIRLIDNINFSL
ncbi:MAG TPA: pantoate--beta-alanine ligase [Bacteroidales bacterium]|nr:pantoate--beta-alanine ligase [Bacteroidales bacterium]